MLLTTLLAISLAVLIFLVFVIVLNIIINQNQKIDNRVKGVSGEGESKKEKARKLRLKAKKEEKENNELTFSKTNKRLEKMEDELYNIGIKLPVQTFVTIWIGAAIGVPALMLLLLRNVIVAIVVFVGCALGPMLIIRSRKNKRKKAIEGQLVEAISVMCNALKAGHSFQTAMSSIAKEMEAPISEEFGRVSKETQRGMLLEDSMERMVERTGSEDLDMLCTAILIQRRVGGNLAEILEKISDTVKSRINLRNEIKTRTSSGRVSGYIVGALPVVLLLAISVMNKEYANVLYATTAGHYMLLFSVIWEAIGFVVINKIVSIKY